MPFFKMQFDIGDNTLLLMEDTNCSVNRWSIRNTGRENDQDELKAPRRFTQK